MRYVVPIAVVVIAEHDSDVDLLPFAAAITAINDDLGHDGNQIQSIRITDVAVGEPTLHNQFDSVWVTVRDAIDNE